MTSDRTDWKEVIGFIEAHSCQWSYQPTEGEWGIHHLDDPPHNRLLGPVFDRGGPSGLIAIDGKIQCQWGDIHRADMTFSVTKSYLALTIGVAVDQGLISDIDQTVHDSLSARGIKDTGFEDAHNRRVTWRHLLQFTSEWRGECFGVPDQIDHYRVVGMQPAGASKRKGSARTLAVPGSYWEYNDIRINQFSYALMLLFDRAIPAVFDEYILSPLSASDQWRWYGYENSWVVTDSGKRVQSVPGGGHWGGGMVISAHDQFLIARLMINNGVHEGRQLLSSAWISQMREPCKIAPWYGFFTWLNTDHVISRSVSEQSYFAMGIGGQLIWHDPDAGLVAVFRWIDPDYTEQILQRVSAVTQNI